ncbi:hypothetical protein EIN_273500 [Entamoeba invadens IP1]|uniref:Uncharacterized protein n=1 Tax=Entamoeba invadens IP1 TaxID=370355 RepID=A0A0A1U4L6_ENTIV|nr:hypothetical protein EIN_273500 [Entamoeba invadens IP1]ELP87823.1 hypothetical protein EIN_273500 [Entamoeba invadens IP1]|eukprot:XP_004254594.1 hypothetical protein EIN_273500 [Entamoeba invadens IP1]
MTSRTLQQLANYLNVFGELVKQTKQLQEEVETEMKFNEQRLLVVSQRKKIIEEDYKSPNTLNTRFQSSEDDVTQDEIKAIEKHSGYLIHSQRSHFTNDNLNGTALELAVQKVPRGCVFFKNKSRAFGFFFDTNKKKHISNTVFKIENNVFIPTDGIYMYNFIKESIGNTNVVSVGDVIVSRMWGGLTVDPYFIFGKESPEVKTYYKNQSDVFVAENCVLLTFK